MLSTIHFTYYRAKVHYFITLMIFFVGGCSSKQQKKKTAHNYYNLAMIELGDAAQGAGAFKKALPYIDAALQVEEKAEYYALKATILFVLGNHAKGEELFKKALQVSKEGLVKLEVLNNYACLLAEAGKTQEALRLWDELIASDEYLTPEVAHVNKGKVLLSQGAVAQAANSFSQAVAYAPGFLDAHYYLALTNLQNNEVQKAKDSINTILYIDQHHPGAALLAQQLDKGVLPAITVS